jgi:hypothetical protein
MEKTSWKDVVLKFWGGIKVLFHLMGSVIIMYYGMTFMAKIVVPMNDKIISILAVGTIFYFMVIFSWKSVNEFFITKKGVQQ